MGLSPQKQNFEKKQRPLPPAGPQHAICYSIIDLGTHMESFQGQEAKPSPKVHFSWEFPHVPEVTFDQAKGPQRLAIFQEYTVSIGDKAKLPKVLCSWRKVAEIKDLATELPQYLGKPCLISVEYAQDKKDTSIRYANIGMKGMAIMPPMTGVAYGEPKNEKMFFNLDQFSWAQFNKLPKWIQEKIQKSLEWSGIVAKFGANPTPQASTTPAVVQPTETMQETPITSQTGNPTVVNQAPVQGDIVQGNPFDEPPLF